MKIKTAKDGDYRYVWKFIWFPTYFSNGCWVWLEHQYLIYQNLFMIKQNKHYFQMLSKTDIKIQNEYPHLYLNSFLFDAEAIKSLSNNASPKYRRLKL